MTFEDALDAFEWGGTAASLDALRWLIANWTQTAPACRAMLSDYVRGIDLSERTERCLFYLVHALGDRQEESSHADICRLIDDVERADLIFGDDAITITVPNILVSTFAGDPAPLQRLVELEQVDELTRGDALLVLAYLSRTGRLTEGWMQQYLAGVLDRLGPREQNFVWFGWARAVAAMGFSGLAAQAERLMREGLIDPSLLRPKDFWEDLRETQLDPAAMSSRAWGEIGPVGDVVAELASWDEDWAAEQPSEAVQQPFINPLRNVGRNDPCPCGSGKKYKKCCLLASGGG